MLSKRVIPCLDVHNGRTVKGINFVDLIDAGNPVEQARLYNDLGADEICFLDISATNEERKTLFKIVSKVAESCFIPLTVGGGIRENSDISNLLKSGADKVSINSAAVFQPELLKRSSDNFGSQCIVLAIDAYKDSDNKKSGYNVSTHGGKKKTKIDALDWAIEGEKKGAGEILLTSMNSDGTKSGYDIELTHKIATQVGIPVIASGGAGKPLDMVNVLQKGKASAVLAASIFHFGIYSIENVKKEMLKYKIPVRKTW